MAQTKLPLLLSFTLLITGLSANEFILQKEKNLDREIQTLYKEVARARELLSYENIDALPSNTIIQFVGTFPNRTGIRIRKFKVDTEHGSKSKLKSSEEKSLLIEFNGSVLSKLEISVSTEDTEIEQKTKTLIRDLTPLDENLNDMTILFSGLDGKTEFPLSDMRNDEIREERNQFKKDFYIKFLLDFHSQISSIIALQKSRGPKAQKNMLKQLNQSLGY
ncbi:MAG: hypothetical protein MUF77_05830 [Leptospira sp.]|jgi:hypothetical protein|nr:hypothetical protein [Leptospira sp.]